MSKATVTLYKDGDQMAVSTDALDEGAFWDAFNAALATLIDGLAFHGDWKFQLDAWLPAAFEIVAKIRGYKSSCEEERVLRAGVGRVYSDTRVAWSDERGPAAAVSRPEAARRVFVETDEHYFEGATQERVDAAAARLSANKGGLSKEQIAEGVAVVERARAVVNGRSAKENP